MPSTSLLLLRNLRVAGLHGAVGRRVQRPQGRTAGMSWRTTTAGSAGRFLHRAARSKKTQLACVFSALVLFVAFLWRFLVLLRWLVKVVAFYLAFSYEAHPEVLSGRVERFVPLRGAIIAEYWPALVIAPFGTAFLPALPIPSAVTEATTLTQYRS